MNFGKFLLFLSLFAAGAGGFVMYRRSLIQQKPPLFKTIHPSLKTVTKIIDASGPLKLKDTYKIGSLVAGTIDQLLVEENASVIKDQPLAVIKTKDEDSKLLVAHAKERYAAAAFEYQANHVKRIEQLAYANQVDKDSYEKELALLKQLEAQLAIECLTTKQEKFLYDQKTVRAPADGIVVAIGIARGQTITTDLQATDLFEISPDTTQIRAHLEIDEGDVSLTQTGQKIEITVDSQPNKTFRGTLKSISYSPKGKGTEAKYEGLVDLNDTEGLLRPGMTAHASIFVASEENTLSVLNQAFFINKVALEEVAKKLKKSFNPLPIKKESFGETEDDGLLKKRAWIHQKDGFYEKEVVLGITDDTYYTIKSGLTESDEVIIDVDEANALDEIYKKIAQR